MGAVIQARCPCGFQSGQILAGGGFKNYKELCAAPALCLKCMQLVIKNYYEKDSKCPECGEKVTFYNDPKLQAPKDAIKGVSQRPPSPFEEIMSWYRKRDVFAWVREEDKLTFRLPNIQYLCPKCQKVTMEFLYVGDWD
jgi:DNA-directed RNA polymerase subunit RPC12/RpoP